MRSAAERHRDPVEALVEAVRDGQPTKAQLGKIHSIWKDLPEPHKGNLKNAEYLLSIIERVSSEIEILRSELGEP